MDLEERAGSSEELAQLYGEHAQRHEHADEIEDAISGAAQDDRYSCPMHPEILRDEPGPCPLCGMALEPLTPTAEEGENVELRDMTRRFWISAALAVPLLWAMLGEPIPAINPMALFGHTNVAWAQLLLATPVVIWGGAPFFMRTRSRSQSA